MGILREMEKRIKNINKAWLAGIIDGEGTLYCLRRKEGINPQFRLFLVNSDMAMMLEAKRIMSQLCDGHIKIKPKYYNEKKAIIKSNLQMWMIEICRQAYVLNILRGIEPYMITKKDKARFFIEILSNHKTGTKWLDSELERIFREPVETKCKAPHGGDEAIVRAYGKP